MAKVSVEGFENFDLDMEALANLPEEAADEMLQAGAEIYKAEQEKQIINFGLVRTGAMEASISISNTKKGDTGGPYKNIYPKGKDKKGTRNAEKAFIAEYGKTNQQPKPWMRTANNKAENPAFEAMEKVYNEKLSKIQE